MTLGARDLDEIVAEIVATANRAGTLLLGGLDRPKTIDRKGEVDLVTEWDRRAEELIRRELDDRFPGFAMLAEEEGASGSESAEYTWIVDPLDGTTNFSHGHPLFAVSIGLEHGRSMVAGAVAIPALGTTAWSRAGGGAFRDGRPIRVSTTSALDGALVATGFPYDRRTAHDDNTAEFVAFIKRSQGVRRCGVAAIDLTLVASGIYDGFWEPRLKAWDLAAGVLLVSEAGGYVTDYQGAPVDIRAGWIVASNGLIHDEMLRVVEEVRAAL
jgi:myo-inositol-1(or 4)-monophosphatase